jgi:DNA repair exonuclease SbcCD ATPase subunit
LRDLQFEFRVGKLSDADYQKTKLDLQRELAKVLAEIDAIQPADQVKQAAAAVAAPAPKPKPGASKKCPHCGASFPQALKFCGECGKAMAS